MKTGGPLAKLLAGTLILGLQLVYTPALAESTATLSGSIVSFTSEQPLSGVTVHAGHPASGEIYSSGATAADGRFVVDELPAGRYELAVESQGGMYLAGTPVELAPGQARNVSLAVKPKEEPIAPDSLRAKKLSSKPGVWSNPLTATMIVLGSLLVVGVVIEAADDDDDTADVVVSPSS